MEQKKIYSVVITKGNLKYYPRSKTFYEWTVCVDKKHLFKNKAYITNSINNWYAYYKRLKENNSSRIQDNVKLIGEAVESNSIQIEECIILPFAYFNYVPE